VRIFTGAMLPASATQVLIQEEVKHDGDWIVPVRRSDSLHIRRRGEDARRGDVLLPTGVQLGPGACALLASIGMVAPLVSEKVRVMHVTTGNELIDPTRVPAVGQIRDSNSTLVAALLLQAGADLAAHEHSKDSLDALLALVQSRAAGECEMLLVSGGASVGAYDFGARALTESGYNIHFDRINLRPGKPTIFASRGAQIAFVIPGNPLAHFVVFHLLVLPTLRMFAGAPMRWPMARLKTSGPVELTSDRRETFWPGRLRFDSGGLSVGPLRWQSSGDMSSLPFVDALIRIPAGAAISRDGSVETLLLDSFHGNSDAHPDE
jgi:molybdopterin molybdotransferase